MAVKLQKPILVGGIGLSLALWLLESFQHSAGELGEVGVLGAIAVSTGFWLFRKPSAGIPTAQAATAVDRETVVKAIAEAESVINRIEAEAGNNEAITGLRSRAGELIAELDRQELNLSITGGKNTGKTKLLRLLESSWLPQHQKEGKFRVSTVTETQALFAGTPATPPVNGGETELQGAIASDLVLFVTTGDLTDPEFQTLQQLASAGVRTVLVWNKQDQYLEAQQPTVLQQLRERVEGILGTEDVVAIAAAPAQVKVRQHQQDGSVIEEMEQPVPQISQLGDRLTSIQEQESQKLVFATTFRAAKALKASAREVLNGVRRDRALPIIEQYQYIAAAAAIANPVPALDLLATGAINAQLVLDLGGIYQQKVSLQQAQAVAGEMAKLMLKLGLVELSTQAIAGVLKTNTITFLAGGAVQGLSAAYLTRLAGLSLIEYFQAQDVSALASGQNLDKLAGTLKTVFEQNQRMAFLQTFIKQVVNRIAPGSKETESLTSQGEALQENRTTERISIPSLEPTS